MQNLSILFFYFLTVEFFGGTPPGCPRFRLAPSYNQNLVHKKTTTPFSPVCFAALVRCGSAAAHARGRVPPLAARNNGITDSHQTSFKKFLVFFKANDMEHSVAQAIRAMTAKICRRLDVLIDAAGKPPVEDVEGTPAPRKPLAPSAAKKNMETPVSPPVPKKRGRPPKTPKDPKTPVPQAAQASASSSSSDEDASQEHAEVGAHIFLYVYLCICQVFYCDRHDMFCLIHGSHDFEKEVYVEDDILKCDVSSEELAAAKAGTLKCVCFPWVRLFIIVFFVLIFLLLD
jgi:hypothetical protein